MEEKKILEDLKRKFKDSIREISSQFGDDSLLIERESLLEIINFLRGEPYKFTMLLDLTCVDYMGQKERFQMVYHLFSIENNLRLRLKAPLPEKDPTISSLTSFWKNANWLEREIYDMFGVQFKGHPDLRRIFMYDGFEGYPLRKDYPLKKRQPRLKFRK
ncbi:MAG: NADH-quinone oxidoreductase subunit C [Candidatus Aminicenantales bacterium]